MKTYVLLYFEHEQSLSNFCIEQLAALKFDNDCDVISMFKCGKT